MVVAEARERARFRARLTAVTPHEIASLFPEDVVVVAGATTAEMDTLYPEERAQVERAVEKRRLEYGAARTLAREALARLGIPPMAIVNDLDRVPRFPEGTVGGITHTRGLCVVAVARASAYRAIGLDAEGASPLDEKLFETILRPEELAAIRDLEPEARGRFAKLVFCIKECAYKAQFPISRKYFGFSGMRVSAEEGRFVATMEIDAPPFLRGHCFEGRYLADAEYVVAGLALAR